MADVLGDVEVGVVDPARQTGKWKNEALPVARYQMQARPDDRRLVSLRLTPRGAAPAVSETPDLDAAPDYRERLRALGDVE